MWHWLPFIKPIWKFEINRIPNLLQQVVKNIPDTIVLRSLIKCKTARSKSSNHNNLISIIHNTVAWKQIWLKSFLELALYTSELAFLENIINKRANQKNLGKHVRFASLFFDMWEKK